MCKYTQRQMWNLETIDHEERLNTVFLHISSWIMSILSLLEKCLKKLKNKDIFAYSQNFYMYKKLLWLTHL